MDDQSRLKYLPIVLRVFGVTLIFGLYLLMDVLDLSGWTWQPRQSEYEEMIMGVYAVLGVVFLFLAGATRCSTAVSSSSRSGRARCTVPSCWSRHWSTTPNDPIWWVTSRCCY